MGRLLEETSHPENAGLISIPSCPPLLSPFCGSKKVENSRNPENGKKQNQRKTPQKRGERMVGDTELESVTSCMSSKRSNQLS